MRRRLTSVFVGGHGVTLTALGADDDIATVRAVGDDMSKTVAMGALGKKGVVFIGLDHDNFAK